MKYTPEEIARIRAESERLLSDEPQAPPEPPAPVRARPIEFEDAMDRWRREAAESDRQRAEAKAELRRKSEELAQSRSAMARIATLEERVAQLEWSLADANAVVDEVANGAKVLSDATLDATVWLQKQLEELDKKIGELRALEDLHRAGAVVPLVRRVN